MASALTGQALLVEDNLIIAMDTSDLLETAGASAVHMASTCEDALSILQQETIDYAVMDVMLDGQTCKEVAKVLQERKIPFVYASGLHEVDDTFPLAERVPKPFSPAELLSALERSISRENSVI